MTTNKVHTALISYIREVSGKESGELSVRLANMNDAEFTRKMFFNHRGSNDDTRGLRLTNFGLTVMKMYFKGYEQKMPEGVRLMPLHLLYLDQHASMPYYCSNDGFFIFDHHLGIKLKLADGHIEILMEIENVENIMDDKQSS